MTLPAKLSLPQGAIQWLNSEGQQALSNYIVRLDAIVAALMSGNTGTLINAPNDAAASRAGVAVGQAYRNGSILQVRVT